MQVLDAIVANNFPAIRIVLVYYHSLTSHPQKIAWRGFLGVRS